MLGASDDELDDAHVHQLPKRIMLIRHGESYGNVDESVYEKTPDWRVRLSARGHRQAVEAGQRLKAAIGDDPCVFYVSPYYRTRETFANVAMQLSPGQLVEYRMEPRLREQDFGNFQQSEGMRSAKEERAKFGRFFYRFPNGESGADVYDRVSTFLETLARDIVSDSLRGDTNVRARRPAARARAALGRPIAARAALTTAPRTRPRPTGRVCRARAQAVIVSHGLTVRLFLMRWFHWPVEVFEGTQNPRNGMLIEMVRRPDGAGYELTEQSLANIGLSLDERGEPVLMEDGRRWLASTIGSENVTSFCEFSSAMEALHARVQGGSGEPGPPPTHGLCTQGRGRARALSAAGFDDGAMEAAVADAAPSVEHAGNVPVSGEASERDAALAAAAASARTATVMAHGAALHAMGAAEGLHPAGAVAGSGLASKAEAVATGSVARPGGLRRRTLFSLPGAPAADPLWPDGPGGRRSHVRKRATSAVVSFSSGTRAAGDDGEAEALARTARAASATPAPSHAHEVLSWLRQKRRPTLATLHYVAKSTRAPFGLPDSPPTSGGSSSGHSGLARRRMRATRPGSPESPKMVANGAIGGVTPAAQSRAGSADLNGGIPFGLMSQSDGSASAARANASAGHDQSEQQAASSTACAGDGAGDAAKFGSLFGFRIW